MAAGGTSIQTKNVVKERLIDVTPSRYAFLSQLTVVKSTSFYCCLFFIVKRLRRLLPRAYHCAFLHIASLTHHHHDRQFTSRRLGQFRTHIRRRLLGHNGLDVTHHDTETTPRQTHNDARIYNVAPGIGQAFDSRNNGGDAQRDRPTDDFTLFGRVHQTHAVEGRQHHVPPRHTVLAGLQGKGTLDNEWTEFLLESLVSFHVGEPEACDNVCTVAIYSVVNKSKVSAQSDALLLHRQNHTIDTLTQPSIFTSNVKRQYIYPPQLKLTQSRCHALKRLQGNGQHSLNGLGQNVQDTRGTPQ